MQDDNNPRLSEPEGELKAGERLAFLSQRLDMGDGRAFVFVPKDFDLRDVTDPERLPQFAAAVAAMDDRESLAAYVNRFKGPGTILFADVDEREVHGAIDWHRPPTDAVGDDVLTVPQPCRNKVVLKLRFSEEFRRWKEFAGQLRAQSEFADFIEENARDVVDPDPAVLEEIAGDLSLSQDVKFRSKVDRQSGDRVFAFEQATNGQDRVRIPSVITLSIPIYHGEAPVRVEARLRFRVSGEAGLRLGIDWHRIDYVRREEFARLAQEVATATGCPIYFGCVSPRGVDKRIGHGRRVE